MHVLGTVEAGSISSKSALRSRLLSTAAALFILTPVCGTILTHGCGAAYAAGGAGGSGVFSNGGAGGDVGTAGGKDSSGYDAGGAAGPAPSGNGGPGYSSDLGNGGGGGGANGNLASPTGGNGGQGGGYHMRTIDSSIGGGGGGAGGNGIAGLGASFTNSGTVQGGYGGNGGYGHAGKSFYGNSAASGGGGGDGGNGIVVTTTGVTITNSAGARINGGDGGNGGAGSLGTYGAGGSGGNGGIGVVGPGQTTVLNSGSINGGYGGNAGQAGVAGATAGVGGAGVSLGAGSILTNSGYVRGGIGGGGGSFNYSAYASATTAGGAGGDGADLGANSTVSNSNYISGGPGGFGSNGFSLGEEVALQTNGGTGGVGGIGVNLGAGSTLMNLAGGRFYGGAGGAGGYGGPTFVGGNGGDGGAGVVTGSNTTVVNNGYIYGGRGGQGGFTPASDYSATARGGNGGDGGAGVVLGANSTLTNTGGIYGGHGGAGGYSHGSSYGTGGNGGAGVIAGVGSTIINSGTILGGDGSAGVGTNGLSGNGGAGIIATSSTITNNAGGLIQGGGISPDFGKGGGIGEAALLASGAAVSPSGATNGVGGVGIIGSDLTINNAGTIAGGLAADGVTRSYGIVFTGGTNYVGGPGTINGGINVTGTSIFQPALPGSAIGNVLQNVNGPLRFDPTATYQVRINPTTADRAIITGLATLNGASVNVLAGAGTYHTMRYTILTATAGVTGTFSALSTTTNLAFLTPTLSYDPNDVYLSLTFANAIVTPSGRRVPNYAAAGSTTNQIAVAGGLTNAAIIANDRGKIFTALNQLTVPQARAAFDTLSGEGYSGAQNLGFKSGELFTSSIFDQTTLYGTGQSGNSITLCDRLPGYLHFGLNDNQCAPIRELADLPSSKAQPVMPFVPLRSWRAWATSYGGVDDIHGNAFPTGSASQNNTLYGGALGVDYQLTPNYLVGVAVGGTDGTFRVADRGTFGSTTGGQIAFYDLATFGNFYGASSTSFAYYANRGTRYVNGFGGLGSETEHGDFNSHEFRSRLEFGRHFLGFGGVLTPFVALEVADLRSNGFTENSVTGAGNFILNESGQSQASVPAFVGARLQRVTDIGGGMILSPTLQAAYVHEFAPYRQEYGQLVSLPGSSFLVDGARPSRNAAQVKAGAELAIGPHTSIYANFEGEFSGLEQFYGGKGGIRYVW